MRRMTRRTMNDCYSNNNEDDYQEVCERFGRKNHHLPLISPSSPPQSIQLQRQRPPRAVRSTRPKKSVSFEHDGFFLLPKDEQDCITEPLDSRPLLLPRSPSGTIATASSLVDGGSRRRHNSCLMKRRTVSRSASLDLSCLRKHADRPCMRRTSLSEKSDSPLLQPRRQRSTRKLLSDENSTAATEGTTTTTATITARQSPSLPYPIRQASLRTLLVCN